MATLQNKIDFALVIAVHHANPNGDPLNGNRPRETYEGYGEISDVCLKRKIRNRMMDLGAPVFVQSDDRSNDGFHSLKERADACPALKTKDREVYAKAACGAWLDVRSQGGTMVLRIEDLDPQRCSLDKAKQLAEDLQWLGLDWDEGGLEPAYCQSNRSHYYQ